MRAPLPKFTVVLLGAALAAGALTVPVRADPSVPSAREVRKSKKQVRERAAAAGRLRAKLVDADARLAKLATEGEVAIEKYNGERVKLQRATAAVTTARVRVQAAEQQISRAHAELTQFAAYSYRTGGGVSPMAAFMAGPGGPQGFLDRASLVQMLASRRVQMLDRVRAVHTVAGVLRTQARQAQLEQERATARAEAARQAAQAAVDRQQQAISQLKRERAGLLEELSKLRRKTKRLERAREAARAKAKASRFSGGRRWVSWSGGSSARRGNIAANWALTQLGKPYLWAADGPSSYDCSGLTMRAWERAGVRLDHWTGSQWLAGPRVSRSRLRRGDLLFFAYSTSNPSTIHHVGMYIGRGLMVHAPQTGDVVKISSIYRGDFIGAVRPG